MQTLSTLLNLPAEIRNKIFGFALVEEHAIEALIEDDEMPYPEDVLPPALARACRQARAGSLPLFYGANTFAFFSYQEALYWQRFLRRFGSFAKYITRIVLKRPYRSQRGCCICLYPNEVSLILSLDDQGAVSISYTGLADHICTCDLEVAASETTLAGDKPFDYNPLFRFLGKLPPSEFHKILSNHYDTGTGRTEKCVCGDFARQGGSF